MFGQKIDDRITMLQRTVALVRDLVLAVVAGLTALIVAYGGDPALLDALDWTRLVAAAFLIVLGPIAVFFVVKLTFFSFFSLLLAPATLFVPDTPIPKGWFAWVVIRVFRISARDYIGEIRKIKQIGARLIRDYPRAWAVVRLLAITYDRYVRFQRLTNPYLVALITLLVAALVFRDTLSRYVP